MFAVLLMLLVGQATVELAGLDVTRLAPSAPKLLIEIDGGKLKGNPVRLAWGDNGTFFLRSAQVDVYQNEIGRNYTVQASGVDPKLIDQEPPWASYYWAWKSASAAPGLPELRFDIETRQQNKTATGSTGQDFGGAGGGTANPNRSDPTANQIAKDYGSMQRIVTTTVRLKGQLISEVQNARVVPGLTFGWAPAPMGALAFVDAKKHLVVIDREGRKMEIAGVNDALLPAWSPDGKQIAFLQKKSGKKYALMVVDVESKEQH
jgi:hypothetical protein